MSEIVDMVKAGITDPAMVTHSALQNAASTAKNILTTEAIVADAPDKQQSALWVPKTRWGAELAVGETIGG